MCRFGRYDRHSDQRPAMELEAPSFGDRNLELSLDLRDDRPHNRPLLLERMHIPEQQLNLKDPSKHELSRCARDQARGFSFISNVSMTSSTLMSLNDPSPIPHSYPSRTSVASSLNRLSDSICRWSLMTTPSRIKRALEFLVMVPERTRQPAMLPNLLDRKTSRISAVPRRASSNSGLSRPLSAASTSSIAW